MDKASAYCSRRIVLLPDLYALLQALGQRWGLCRPRVCHHVGTCRSVGSPSSSLGRPWGNDGACVGRASADMSAPADQSAAPRRHSSHAATPEPGVHPLFLAHDRRVPRLEGIWHRPCLDSLATAPCAASLQRAAGSLAGRLLPLTGGALGDTAGDRRRARPRVRLIPPRLCPIARGRCRVEPAIDGLGDGKREAEERCTQST
jgi:hypothetical protein